MQYSLESNTNTSLQDSSSHSPALHVHPLLSINAFHGSLAPIKSSVTDLPSLHGLNRVKPVQLTSASFNLHESSFLKILLISKGKVCVMLMECRFGSKGGKQQLICMAHAITLRKKPKGYPQGYWFELGARDMV